MIRVASTTLDISPMPFAVSVNDDLVAELGFHG